MRRAADTADFLEQVVAERREYARRADRRGTPEVRRDNLWTHAQRTGYANGRWDTHADDALTGTLARLGGAMGVIAEVKRVSPALGVLRRDVDAGGQARAYVGAGACAISVLTEPLHWGGSLDDVVAVRDAIGYDAPILCKDVVVSEIQIDQARAAGADAVLLVAEALGDDELQRFVARARSLHMGALVEAHEPDAFGRAVAAGSPTVGVNARDLRQPQRLDRERVRLLHTLVRPDQVLVAESGISSVDDVLLLPARVGAVLVGTALMRADDPAPLIASMANVRRAAPAAPEERPS